MKKIIILLLILFVSNQAFATTINSWSTTCGCNGYTIVAIWWTDVFYSCGANTFGSDCSSDCAYCVCGNMDLSGTCTCDTSNGWTSCNAEPSSGDGCETNLLENIHDNYCTTCGTTCGTAPCINGVCADDELWSSCKLLCNCATQDRIKENWGRSDGNYEQDESHMMNNDQCTAGGNQCYTEDDYSYCECKPGYRDCNGAAGNTATSYDGCETNTNTNLRKCGSCTNNCYNIGCSGSHYLGYTSAGDYSYTSEADVNSVCNMGCSAGSCVITTKLGSNCDAGNDCVSGTTCASDTDLEHWCCPVDTCGHDGLCYDVYEEIDENGEFFICDYVDEATAAPPVIWKSIPKVLSLGGMLQYNRDNTLTEATMDDTVYFTNTGVATDCNPSGYRSCVWGPAHYAYQYCTSVSTVFDGMFNLEVSNSVPIQVSEQALYDPYGETTDVLTLEGCGPEGLNC